MRVPALISRALAHDGFAGVLAYTLAEALWLHETGISDDIVVAYPTVDAARAASADRLARGGRRDHADGRRRRTPRRDRRGPPGWRRRGRGRDQGRARPRRRAAARRPAHRPQALAPLRHRRRGRPRAPRPRARRRTAGRGDDLRGPGRRRPGRRPGPAHQVPARTSSQAGVDGAARGAPSRDLRGARPGHRARVLERRWLGIRRGHRRRPGRHRDRRRLGAAGARASSTTTRPSSRARRRTSGSG